MRCAFAKSSPQSKAKLELVPQPGSSVPPPAGARSADLRRLAEALRALARGRKSSRQYHLEVAKCVIDEIYGGKLEALRSEGEHGPSFRELARDLGGTIKKTTLHRALWAYEVRETTPIYLLPAAVLAEGVPTLEQRILAGVPTLEQVSPDEQERLGVSHLYEVRGLDTALRSALLSRALRGRWSVRRLRREIEARTGAPTPSARPAILSMLLELRNLPSTMDLSPLAALSEADARMCQDITEKLHDLVVRAQGALAKRLPAKGSA